MPTLCSNYPLEERDIIYQSENDSSATDLMPRKVKKTRI